MLSFGMVILFCVYFYANTIQRIVVIYKDAAGIWKEDMLRCYLSCGLNLLVNIVTVGYIGLYGVIGSSVAANVIGLPWMAFILYKTVFKESSKEFYLNEIKDAAIAVIVCFLTLTVCNLVPFGGVMGLLVKAAISVILSNLLLFVCYFKSKQFALSKDWVLGVIKRKVGNKK